MKWHNTTKPVTVYLASGWFNAAQEEARQDILRVLNENKISYFSPKDEVEVKLNATSEERKAAFKADRNTTRLNSSHQIISYAVFCLKTQKNSASPQARPRDAHDPPTKNHPAANR